MAKKAENKITALDPRSFLIKRINIYFGREMGDVEHPFSTQKGILVREVIDNAVDAIYKFNKNETGNVNVTFHKDKSVTVYDSGPGIPVELSKTADGKKASSLYLALGVLNAGSNYENPTDSLGTNGVGGSGAQMLSEYMHVTVYSNKKQYTLHFKDGVPGIFDDNGKFKSTEKDLSWLKVEKDSRPAAEKKEFPTGTKIHFKINNKVLKSPYDYDVEDLKFRIKGTSFLRPGIVFTVTDEINANEDGSPKVEVFNYGGGLEKIVDLETASKITPIISLSNNTQFEDDTVDISDNSVKKILKEVKAEASFAWSPDYEYKLDSYVNTIRTRLGGVHVTAFERALVNVFNAKLSSMRGYLTKSDKTLPIDQDYREGLTLAVSVSIPEPDFTSQIKEELSGKEALKVFTQLFTESLEGWINDRKNQEHVKAIADKVIEAFRIRVRRKEEIELQREQKKAQRNSKMPVKLIDCEMTYTEFSELFICEGDSAASSIKGARDSRFQALFPIRGKITNVLKAKMKDVLANQEVQDIIKCLDCGFGKDMDTERLRYSKVFIAADEDTDGGQIACLLLVLFWVMFPKMLEEGRLYKMSTPLFTIKQGKEEEYYYNAREFEAAIAKKKTKNYTVIRAKGLGELDKKIMSKTGLKPETRYIKKITMEDVEEAKQWLEIAMGTEVAPRRQWIVENPIDSAELN